MPFHFPCYLQYHGRAAADLMADFFERMSNAGIERIQSRYTWGIYAARLLSLCQVYSFWKHVTTLSRQDTKRYLESLYILLMRRLVEKVGGGLGGRKFVGWMLICSMWQLHGWNGARDIGRAAFCCIRTVVASIICCPAWPMPAFGGGWGGGSCMLAAHSCPSVVLQMERDQQAAGITHETAE